MNCYAAYRQHKPGRTLLIKQGFHWRLFFLGPLGLLFTRSWIGFALSGCATALIFRFGGAYSLWGVLAVALMLASFGADIIAAEARLRGDVAQGVWMGRNSAEAALRLMDRQRGIA